MAGIAGIPAGGASFGANPLSGLGGAGGPLGGGSLSGLGDMGGGTGTGGAGAGLAPNQPANKVQGASFGDALRSMVIDGPSASKAASGDLARRFAAGDTSIDPHQLSIASAKAGVEIQMATRTISSAVSAVRTLFQMQV